MNKVVSIDLSCLQFGTSGINCRMRMMSFVYRSDLLLLFTLLIFFGVLFNILTWLHEPPDTTKIDLSYSKQRALIEEWRLKYEQESKKKSQHVLGFNKENNDNIQDDNSNKNYGGDDMVNGDLNNQQANHKDQLNNQRNKENVKYEFKDFDFEIVHDDKNKYDAMYMLKEKGSNKQANKQDTLHKGEKKEVKSNDAVNQNINVNAPVGGKLVGGPAQCTTYDLTTNISANYECVNIAIKPTVKVCLYPNEQDIHISQHIRNVGLWEPHIVKEFQNIMFSNPDYGFIDIGANIGQYSLIAARMGHTVVSVEPFKENIRHLHMAVKLGRFEDKITLVRNAISDQRQNYAALWVDPVNHGGVRLDRSIKDPCLHSNCSKAVKSIFMDDLLEVVNFQKAVMKVDIEGHEHRAFIYSQGLFEKLFISHIIMEWMQLRGYYGAETTESKNKDLVFKLVATLTQRGYKAYSLVTGIELKPKFWFSWPDDIIWRHELEEFN